MEVPLKFTTWKEQEGKGNKQRLDRKTAIRDLNTTFHKQVGSTITHSDLTQFTSSPVSQFSNLHYRELDEITANIHNYYTVNYKSSKEIL